MTTGIIKVKFLSSIGYHFWFTYDRWTKKFSISTARAEGSGEVRIPHDVAMEFSGFLSRYLEMEEVR